MRAAHAFLAAALLAVACSKKAEPQKTKPEAKVAQAPAAAEPPKEATLRAMPLSKPIVDEGPHIDPEKVPVEEDFVGYAEERVTRRSNLELELKRIATELQASKQGAANVTTSAPEKKTD